MWSERDVERVLAMRELSSYEIARRTGIPRGTVSNWLAGRTPTRRPPPPAINDLPPAEYALLLGFYLGDGCISRVGRTWRLEVFQDARYPESAKEIAAAMTAVSSARVRVRPAQRSRMLIVGAYWEHWPSVFPQHGPGRKHERAIVLTDEQLLVTHAHPRQIVRGLLHSDGSRYVARQRCTNGKTYAYSRYAFGNNSLEIIGILCEHLELLGIGWTRPDRESVAIDRRTEVAKLDEFVGPKR